MNLKIPKYNLNFSSPVVGYGNFGYNAPKDTDTTMVDTSIVETKFKMWQYVLENKLLTSEDEYKRLLAWNLLKDKTIFAYHYFNFDNMPFKSRFYQDVIFADNYDRILFAASNQIGKEQPYSSKVLTPEGFKLMKDIKKGDYVIGEEGYPVKVLQTFEQGIKDVYELEFDDGTKCECGIDHLWKYQDKTSRYKFRWSHGKKERVPNYNKYKIGSLKQIIDIDGFNPKPYNRVIIPVCSPVEFKKKDLEIPPYVLGVLLGDGCLRHRRVEVYCHPDDIMIINKLKYLGVRITKMQHPYGYRIHNLTKPLKNLGLMEKLSNDKFIPIKYKYSSVYDRLELLRGLMDTDGSIYGKGTVEFCSVSNQLALDVAELVYSLGGKAKLRTKQGKYKKCDKVINCQKVYRIMVKLQNHNPFYLKRKADKHYIIRYRKERILRHIKKVRKEMSKCILVDSPNHTYLTDNYIVTHNSIALNVDAAIEFLRDHKKGWVGLLVSNSLDQSMYQMDRVKMLLKSANINYREEDTVDKKTGKKDNATKVSYTFYSKDGKTPLYTNLLICCPHTSSALGYPADNIWLDEFDFWEDVKGGQEHFINQIIIPRTYDTEGKIKIFSNPDGQEKFLHKLWNQVDDNGKPVWNRYNFNYWDKPGATQDKFNRNIIGKTRQEIDSTLLAKFSRSSGSFLSVEEINDSIDHELTQKGKSAGYGKETAWFMDVGSVHDQSCLVGAYITENDETPDIPIINIFYIHKYPVGYPLARVVGIDTGANDGWEDYVKDNPSVKEILDEYSEIVNDKKYHPMFGIDVTGNSGISPLFNTADIEPIDIVFSGKKKWQMYQRMQYYFQQRYLKRVYDQDDNTINQKNGDYQLSKLIVKSGTATSYRQVHHENEDDFDDVPDAIAGVIHLIENPDLPSLSFDIINEGESKLEEIEEEKAEIKQLKKNNPELENQYIPSFYNAGELDSWLDNKEKNKR